MEICKRCKYEVECLVSSESDFCLNYAPRPLTNADRIRSMTDEELAEFLFHAWNNAAWCSEKDCPDEESCFPCWLNWLKQEAT